MSRIKQFAGQTLIYGGGSILSRVINYLVFVVLLTYLLRDKTEEFGTYAFFYAYASVLITLFSFRLDTALFRYGNKQEGKLSASFNTTLTAVIISALGLGLIGLSLAQPIADLIGFSDKPEYVRWFAFIMAFDVINLIPFAKLRLTNRAKAFALYKIFNVFLLVILALLFLVVLPKTSLWSLLPERSSIVDWVFIANLIASGVLMLSLLPTMKGYRPKIDTALISKMVSYTFPLVIVGMANGFIQFFGVPLQKMFLGGEVMDNLGEAGVYDFTRRVAGLFVLFTTAFNYAAEPFFFNNSSEQDKKNLYGKICRLFVLVGGVILLGLYLGVDLLKYLADSNYWESLHLLPILLIAYLLLGIYYNVSIWYKLSDNTIYGAIISVIGVVITLVISIALLPRIGYAASAWATLATYAVMVILGYFIGQAKFPITYPVRKILQDLLVLILLIICAYLVKQNWGIGAKYFSFALLMVGYLFYVWKSEEEEWRRVFGRAG